VVIVAVSGNGGGDELGGAAEGGEPCACAAATRPVAPARRTPQTLNTVRQAMRNDSTDDFMLPPGSTAIAVFAVQV
jgi:hypothetical protein